MSKSIERRLILTTTIKDCDVETFTVGGHGGTGKDTSNTGVRIVHRASGAVGRAVDYRSQRKNKETAFRRMAESKEFRAWIKQKACNVQHIERRIEKEMDRDNLKVEYRIGTRWEEVE